MVVVIFDGIADDDDNYDVNAMWYSQRQAREPLSNVNMAGCVLRVYHITWWVSLRS